MNAGNPKISIVVPVYNVEKYLRKCLDSLVSQSLSDIEIICVDDCSTDGSAELLKEYAASDKRVRFVCNSVNRSVLQARKTGVVLSRGEYIMFVDSDDSIEHDACEELYDLIKGNQADILHFDSNVIALADVADIDGVRNFIAPYVGSLNDSEVLESCFAEGKYRHTLWNKIYSADVCKEAHAHMVDGRCDIAEDFYTYFLIAFFAKSYVGVAGKRYYNYSYGTGVTSGRTVDLSKLGKLCRQSYAIESIRKFLAENNLSARYSGLCQKAADDYVSGCVWNWFSLLPKEDAPAGFDMLLAAWGIVPVMSSMVKMFYWQQSSLAERVLRSKSLQTRRRPVKNVGVFYHRIRSGGVERVLSLLIRCWTDLGYSVVLFTDEVPSEEDYSLPEGTKRVVLPSLREQHDDAFERRGRVLCSAVQENDLDVFVHNSGSSEGLLYDVLSVKALGVPVVISCHEFFSGSMSWLSDSTVRNVSVYRVADAIIVLSETDRLFWRTVGVNALYIPNPLTFDFKKINRSRLDSKNVIWVGRFSDEKQYLHPIQIFAEVSKSVPDAKLLMLGKGEGLEPLELVKKEIFSLGLESKVVLCGYFKDVDDFYRMSSVYLTTSMVESFSMTLYESKAHGVPCVAYEMSYLEVLRDGLGYVSVDQGDKIGAAKSIISLLTNETYRKKMGDEAYSSALKFFEAVDVGREWRILFNSISDGAVLDNLNKSHNCNYEVLLKALIFHYNQGLESMRKKSSGGGFVVSDSLVSDSSFAHVTGYDSVMARELVIIMNSYSFKLGRAFTWLPRQVVKLFRYSYFLMRKFV